MSIKTNIKIYPVSWLKETRDSGGLNTDISIQRKEVWGSVLKSNFIVSLLLEIPIESLLFERVNDDTYNVLDGKQRTLTLCSFINNEFSLSAKVEVKEINGVTLVKQKFKNLPERLQNKILNYQLSFAILEPLNEEQRERVFYLRNQSVHLSKMDLSRVVLGKRERDLFTKMCNHNFMLDKVVLTKKARQNHDDLKILLQFLILHYKPGSGFSAAEIMDFCQELNNKIFPLTEKNIEPTLHYINKAFPEKQPYMKKIHLPSILWLAEIARINKMDFKNFGDKINTFFTNLTPDSPYTLACKSGRSKRPDVQARLKALGEVFRDMKYREIQALY